MASDIEKAIHAIGTAALLSRIASRYVRHLSEDDKDSINRAISDAGEIYKIPVVPVGGGILSLEPETN